MNTLSRRDSEAGEPHIQYSHSYNGTNDNSEKLREMQWKKIKTRTINLFKKYLKVDEFKPDFSSKLILDQVLDISRKWYGFEPRINSEIQFFNQIGLTATEVERDGNCFFHALEYLLEDSYDYADYKNLRRLADRLVPGNNISDNGRWIDLNFEEIARELARELEINIVLIEQGANFDQLTTVLEHNFYYGGSAATETIFIGNIGNMHFVPLEIQEESYNQLQSALQNHIATLTGTFAAENTTESIENSAAIASPLENLKTVEKSLLDLSDNEPDEEAASEAEKGSDNNNSDQDSSNTTVNCLYNITYNNPDIYKLFDCKDHLYQEQYHLTIAEQDFLHSFNVTELEVLKEPTSIFLISQEQLYIDNSTLILGLMFMSFYFKSIFSRDRGHAIFWYY